MIAGTVHLSQAGHYQQKQPIARQGNRGVFAKALRVWLDFTRVWEHTQLTMNTILMVDIVRGVCTQYQTVL